MPFAKSADGIPLHYTVHDYCDRWHDRPTIMLVHGFARSGEFWFNMVPYLARFFRVICPDLRGLGRSVPLPDPASSLNAATYGKDLIAVADHAGVDAFHLVGESIGGAISLIFAAEHPERVRTLSVLAPAIFANEWIRQAYAIGHPTWPEAIRTLGVEGWARQSNTLARFPANIEPAFLDWYAKEVGRNDIEVVVAMTGFAGSVDARPYLPRIEAPVLALYPTSGDIATSEQEDLLTRNVRNVRVSRLRTPHQMLGMLMPAACAQQILALACLNEGFVARE